MIFMSDKDGINGGYPVLTWQELIPDLIIGSYEQLKAFADDVNSGNTSLRASSLDLT